MIYGFSDPAMKPSFAAILLIEALAPQGPLDRLPQDRAGEIVRRAIDYAGGFDTWAAKRTVEFRKTTIRYRPDGTVERKRVQQHRYVLRPRLHARIEWEEDGQEVVLINDGFQAWKLVDGVEATTTADRNEARNATFGSHYVFNMPFKLADPGAHLSYAGRETLADGTVTDKVLVSYDKGAGDAGGFHTWTYYFDTKAGRLRANHLKFGPADYDFTEYLDDEPMDGLRLSTRRYGYAATAKGRQGPMTSEIVYEDVRWDAQLDEALFSVPAK